MPFTKDKTVRDHTRPKTDNTSEHGVVHLNGTLALEWEGRRHMASSPFSLDWGKLFWYT
jgi:hypothetical protein